MTDHGQCYPLLESIDAFCATRSRHYGPSRPAGPIMPPLYSITTSPTIISVGICTMASLTRASSSGPVGSHRPCHAVPSTAPPSSAPRETFPSPLLPPPQQPSRSTPHTPCIITCAPHSPYAPAPPRILRPHLNPPARRLAGLTTARAPLVQAPLFAPPREPPETVGGRRHAQVRAGNPV